MTSVREAATTGSGRILANFREIPALARPMLDEIVQALKAVGIGGVVHVGNASEAVCQIRVGLNKLGMILLGGMNPIAVAEEAGLDASNTANSGLIDFEELVSFYDL